MTDVDIRVPQAFAGRVHDTAPMSPQTSVMKRE